MNNEHEIFEQRVKKSLEDSASNLDLETKRRLREIRQQALNAGARSHWTQFNFWVPAATLAFCSVLVVMLVLPSQKPGPSRTFQTAQVEQSTVLDLMENPDELDALSDPGFYAWLDEVEDESNPSHAV